MAQVTDFLYLGTKLSTKLAENTGGKVVEEAKKIVIDLTKKGKRQNWVRKTFCPGAEQPKMLVQYEGNQASKTIGIQFLDGERALSNGNLTQLNDGEINFLVNMCNSKGVSHARVSGRYNPNKPLFEWNNCGETLEHRYGYTRGRVDSTGFAIDAKVRDESVLSLIRNIKNFFTKEIG